MTESTIGTLSLDLITCQPVSVRSTTSDHRQESSGLHQKDPFINHCPVPRPGVVLSDKTYETRFVSVWVPRPQFSRHFIPALIHIPPPDRSLCTTIPYRHRPRDIDHWFLIHAKSANHANINIAIQIHLCIRRQEPRNPRMNTDITRPRTRKTWIGRKHAYPHGIVAFERTRMV